MEENKSDKNSKSDKVPKNHDIAGKATGYYCPMHCEGEKRTAVLAAARCATCFLFPFLRKRRLAKRTFRI